MNIREFATKYCQDIVMSASRDNELFDTGDFSYDEIVEDLDGTMVKVVNTDNYQIPIADIIGMARVDFAKVWPQQECLEMYDKYVDTLIILEGADAVLAVRNELLKAQERLHSYEKYTEGLQMIEVQKYHRDMDFTGFDYIFEDTKKFNALLPFLLPKLDGQWRILIIEPKLSDVRSYLDAPLIPSYVFTLLAVEATSLDQLYLERPQLVVKEKSNWDAYMDLIKEFPVPLEDKAMREIYYRRGPKLASLRTALTELEGYRYITMREVNKHFAPVVRVFANQVVRAFLLGKSKQAWKLLSVLESEVGSAVAFWAMRKNVRRLFEEKCKYMRNEEIKDRLVEQVDGYTLISLFWLFEEADNVEQLYPLLAKFERREMPC